MTRYKYLLKSSLFNIRISKRMKEIKNMKKMVDEEIVFNKLIELGKDILFSSSYQKLHTFIKHGNTTTFIHCVMVTYFSLLKAEEKNKKYDEKSLVRGGLLHDYYLYDWHDKTFDRPRPHGIHHPSIALKNAKRDYNINEIEEQIIKRHMFPLTIVPPIKKEARIISLQDKRCSLKETINDNPYEKYEYLLNMLKDKIREELKD